MQDNFSHFDQWFIMADIMENAFIPQGVFPNKEVGEGGGGLDLT